MSIEESVQTVKNFLAALGDRNKQGLLELAAEDIGFPNVRKKGLSIVFSAGYLHRSNCRSSRSENVVCRASYKQQSQDTV
jgi:hypothetical protein